MSSLPSIITVEDGSAQESESDYYSIDAFLRRINIDPAIASLTPAEDRYESMMEGDGSESKEETVSMITSEVGDRPVIDTLDLATRAPDYSIDAYLKNLTISKRAEKRSQTMPRSMCFSAFVLSAHQYPARDDVPEIDLSPLNENYDWMTEEYTTESDDETESSVCVEEDDLNIEPTTTLSPSGEVCNGSMTEGDSSEPKEEAASVVCREVVHCLLKDTLDLATRTHGHSTYGVLKDMSVAKSARNRSQTFPSLDVSFSDLPSLRDTCGSTVENIVDPILRTSRSLELCHGTWPSSGRLPAAEKPKALNVVEWHNHVTGETVNMVAESPTGAVTCENTSVAKNDLDESANVQTPLTRRRRLRVFGAAARRFWTRAKMAATRSLVACFCCGMKK